MEQILFTFIKEQIESAFREVYEAETYSITLDPFQDTPELYLTGTADIETLERGEETVSFHYSIYGEIFSKEIETYMNMFDDALKEMEELTDVSKDKPFK